MAATPERTPPALGLLAGPRVGRPRPPARRLRRCSSTASSPTRAAARPRRRSTPRPRSRWPRSPSPARTTSRTPSQSARAAQSEVGRAARARARQVPVPDRAADPGARPRAGDRGDDGRRQADPRVARHRHPARRRALLPLRGLGRQARLRPRGPRARAARRRRPDRAVELPAADGGLEARARAGVRQHRDPQAGRDDAADRAAAGRDLPGGRAAARRRLDPHRRRARPAPRSCAPRASTRSPSRAPPRSARTSRPRWPAATSASRSSSAASRPTSCSRTPRIDQAVEGIVQGIFFNQGHVCCAGSRLLVQESVAEAVEAKLWERMQQLRLGDPLDKNTDVGAVNSGEQLERIETLVAAGEEEGAVRRTRRLRPARARPLVRADAVHRGLARAPDRGRGDLRPGRLDAHVPHPGRGDREGQQLAATASRPASGPTRAARRSRSPRALQAGVVWQNTYNHFDPTAAFGGYKESGFGREGGAAGLRPYVRV